MLRQAVQPTAALTLAVGFVLVIAACSLPTGRVDEPCLEHADPVDCQAALEAAWEELNPDPERFTVSVAPIACTADGCTTWVISTPIGDECLPHGEIEVGRGLVGGWSVLTITHGDPPCAFGP